MNEKEGLIAVGICGGIMFGLIFLEILSIGNIVSLPENVAIILPLVALMFGMFGLAVWLTV
jgi:hypothetical protein